MGLGIAGLVATVALAIGGGHATAAARPIVFGTEASNKHLAEAQAERELRSVKLPPGARRVSSSPAPILDEALGTRGEPNLVQRWEWLVAPGTVAGTLHWFRAHAPVDSSVDTRDELGGPTESASSLWFEVPGHGRRVSGPSVIPGVTGLSGRRVGIRLEVQEIWITPHPAAAKVPSAARVLYVSRASGGGRPRWQVIRAPRRVRRIARVIDQLPAAQPQLIFCPEEFPGSHHVEVTMRFKEREGGPVLAEASQEVPGVCGQSMSLTVRGDSRTFGLDYGERAIELLHR